MNRKVTKKDLQNVVKKKYYHTLKSKLILFILKHKRNGVLYIWGESHSGKTSLFMTSELDVDYLTSLELENIIQNRMLNRCSNNNSLSKRILILDNIESFTESKTCTDTMMENLAEFIENQSKMKVVVCISIKENKIIKDCFSLKLKTPYLNRRTIDKIIRDNKLHVSKEQRNKIISKCKRDKYYLSEILGELKMIDLMNRIE